MTTSTSRRATKSTKDRSKGLVLRAGVQNLTDKDPPIFPSWSLANTDASQYDVLGRRYFIGVEYRL